MNGDEIGKLLGLMALADNRKPPEDDEGRKAMIAFWLSMVGDLTYRDAAQAVQDHYRDSRDWIMPVDVRAALPRSAPSACGTRGTWRRASRGNSPTGPLSTALHSRPRPSGSWTARSHRGPSGVPNDRSRRSRHRLQPARAHPPVGDRRRRGRHVVTAWSGDPRGHRAARALP